jgi:serine/threonine protein phosphatase PrpC
LRELFVSAFEPVRYAALTDVGVKRSHNQDACAARPAVDAPGYEASGHVFVVADGMGGHAVGEKASAKAVQDIPHLYQKHAHEGVAPALHRAFAETNAGIHAIGQENPEFRGMGTTSTALILRPEGAWVGHVGDSRAYRIRDGIAEQLTFDHSWVWEIAKRQGVDPDELGDFKKNVIIRSLGPDPEVEVDIEGPHPVQPGDIYLLCSDGLTGLVNPTEIGAVVTAMPPDTAVRLLVHLANLRGGPDNITVMIIRVPGGAQGDEKPHSDTAGGFHVAVRTWNRLVPWPFTAIGAGCALALVSLLMHQSQLPAAIIMFALSALAIVAGLLGLFLQVKKEPANPLHSSAEQPRSLNVYKRHQCAITPELAEKFAEVEKALADGMMGQGVPVDWEAHAQILENTDSPDGKASEGPTFRARCESLLFLAEAFHKSRHKQELFRPSWKNPDAPNDSASAV